LPDEQRRRAGPRPAQCQRPRQPHEGFVRPVPVAAARRLGLRLRLRQRGDRQNTAVGIGNTNAPLAPNNPIPADRPFHSLSYPDINYTIMRPAALPPSLYTDPQLPTPPPSSSPVGTTPASTPASQLLVPPAIPVRRLFQPPDASPPPSPTPLPIWSNASEQGDTYINTTAPTAASVATGGLPPYLVPQTGGTSYSVNDNY